MPVTVSYDISGATSNQRNYIRSAFERFGWKRYGGSVLRYDGNSVSGAMPYEDWLNNVVPALMFFRSYVLKNRLTLTFFTIDAAGTTFLDHSDPSLPLGVLPTDGRSLSLVPPTNVQSAEQALRDFVDRSTDAAP